MIAKIKVSEKIDFLINTNDVASIFAKWAIKQSPYTVPDNLSAAILSFVASFKMRFRDHNWTEDYWVENISETELKDAVYNIILDESFSETMAWNTPKNGNKTQFKFVSRYSAKGDPDADFVDLHALARNVSREIIETGRLTDI